MKAGYGYNRTARDFKGMGIDTDLIYIDTPATMLGERRSLEVRLRSSSIKTVVLVKRGDIGRGMRAKKFTDIVEAAGATIEIIEPPKKEKQKVSNGVKWFDDLSQEDQQAICSVRDQSESVAVSKVKRDLKVDTDREQLYYVCVTRPKRRAAAKSPTPGSEHQNGYRRRS